jgi:hypothetical protein
LPPIVDLSKVYSDSTPAELKAILENGYVSTPTEDPNDRSFVSQMQQSTTLVNQNPQQNIPTQNVNPMPAQQMGNANVGHVHQNQQHNSQMANGHVQNAQQFHSNQQTQVGNAPAQQVTHQQSGQVGMQANGVQHHSNIGMNAQNNVSHSNVAQNIPAPEVDDEIARMQAILNS